MKTKKKKFINCHACESLNVEKTLMSPSVLISKDKKKIDIQDHKYKKLKKQ